LRSGSAVGEAEGDGDGVAAGGRDAAFEIAGLGESIGEGDAGRGPDTVQATRSNGVRSATTEALTGLGMREGRASGLPM
jgi:hypothetical protein